MRARTHTQSTFEFVSVVSPTRAEPEPLRRFANGSAERGHPQTDVAVIDVRRSGPAEQRPRACAGRRRAVG